MSVEPLHPGVREGRFTYVVAGGNRVTIELDRQETDGALEAIEVLALPGGGPPPVDPPGPAELGEIAARWGIESWSGEVRRTEGGRAGAHDRK